MQVVTYLHHSWQGAKSSSCRPGVVREIRGNKALILPCSTAKQYSKDGFIRIPQGRSIGFHRDTNLVLNYGARIWVNASSVRHLNELPDDIVQQVLAWEQVHTVWSHV